VDKNKLDSILEVAFELKISTLKAEENEICRYSSWTNNFQVSSCLFREMFKEKEYKVSLRDDNYKYLYQGTISGLTFIAISNDLLFQKDADIKNDERIEKNGL